MKSPSFISFMKSSGLLWWTPRLPHPHLPFFPWRAHPAAGEFMPHVPHNILPIHLFYFLNYSLIFFWLLWSDSFLGVSLSSYSEGFSSWSSDVIVCHTSTGTCLGQWHDLVALPVLPAELQVHLLCPGWEWLHWKLHRAGDECWPDLISSGLAPYEIHLDQLGALVLRTRWPKMQLFAIYQ